MKIVRGNEFTVKKIQLPLGRSWILDPFYDTFNDCLITFVEVLFACLTIHGRLLISWNISGVFD